jgi:multicomponent Na+:H+ antiporter subunit B
MDDLVTRSVCRFLVPFIQIYGIYLVFYGHLSPGGGFAGGAIVGSSIILYALAFGRTKAEQRLSHAISHQMESSGGLWYILMGLVGIMGTGAFLANEAGGFYLGVPGHLFSSGMILLLALGIGVKVSSTMVTLFYNLTEEVDDDHGDGA